MCPIRMNERARWNVGGEEETVAWEGEGDSPWPPQCDCRFRGDGQTDLCTPWRPTHPPRSPASTGWRPLPHRRRRPPPPPAALPRRPLA